MIDFQEMLQRLAIGRHTDDDREFWSYVCIEIFFDSPNEVIFNWLKKIEYLPERYLNVAKKYGSFIIGGFQFYGLDIIFDEKFHKPNINKWWRFADFEDEKNKDAVCIHKSGSVWMTGAEEPTIVASSFSEFMNECVFGKRYLEFNGGNVEDNTYRYLKTFREDLEEGYINMSAEDRREIQQTLDDIEAKIRYEERRGNCVCLET